MFEQSGFWEFVLVVSGYGDSLKLNGLLVRSFLFCPSVLLSQVYKQENLSKEQLTSFIRKEFESFL